MTSATVSLRKAAVSGLIVAGLIAGNLLTAATASAGEWRHRDRGYHAPRHAAPYYGYRHHAPAPQHRRDRTGDAVGAAILGIGALIIGAAVADAARNKHRGYDRYED